jgi:type III restriction enzyme
LKQAVSPIVELADPIPPLVVPEGVDVRSARLGAYDVFPPNMNENERRFAELLDSDDSGRVKWWLRLQENANWAVTLMLPTGKRFFPDFAVGVAGRRTPDAIALIETKDDGVTGRLHSETNREKITALHQDYRNVRWTYQGERGWTELHYNEPMDQIQDWRPFSIDHLATLS